jgi:perosamine synthetase
MIKLSSPNLGKEELQSVNKCITSSWLSSSGKYTKKFEKKLESFTGSKNVVTCQSGSAALFLSFKLLNIKPKSEIFVPSITFVSPVNAIIQNNCVPLFIDVNDKNQIEINNLKMFIDKNTIIKNKKLLNIKTGRQISAIIIPHLFGQCAIDSNFVSFCKKKKLFVIEDAAEGLGVFLKKKNKDIKHVGTFGDIGCLSFNVNKIITTGGGGALLLKSNSMAKYAKYLINQSKDNSEFYYHNETGYNLNLPNINSAIGYEQLKKVKKFLKKKKEIYKSYKNGFKNLTNNVEIIDPDKNIESNYWLNILKIKSGGVKKLYYFLKKNKIETRLLWYPNHLQKDFKKYQKTNLNRTYLNYKCHLCLPSGTNLTRNKINKVIKVITNYYENNKK